MRKAFYEIQTPEMRHFMCSGQILRPKPLRVSRDS